jgi:hypothetical protein
MIEIRDVASASMDSYEAVPEGLHAAQLGDLGLVDNATFIADRHDERHALDRQHKQISPTTTTRTPR